MAEPHSLNEGIPISETVHPNRDFILFNPAKTEHREVPIESGTFSTEILLDSGTLPILPFQVFLQSQNERYSKGFVLTPFDPEIGNGIMSTDMDPQTRLQRLVENKEELGKKVDSPRTTHMLTIQAGASLASSAVMKTLGFDMDLMEFNPEYLEKIKKLRLILNFPRGLYIARPTSRMLANGIIDFSFFYPADTGPLPANEQITKEIPELPYYLAEGFPLLLPFNKSELETIRGRFLVEEV